MIALQTALQGHSLGDIFELVNQAKLLPGFSGLNDTQRSKKKAKSVVGPIADTPTPTVCAIDTAKVEELFTCYESSVKDYPQFESIVVRLQSTISIFINSCSTRKSIEHGSSRKRGKITNRTDFINKLKGEFEYRMYTEGIQLLSKSFLAVVNTSSEPKALCVGMGDSAC
jgi:hypothetical protein